MTKKITTIIDENLEVILVSCAFIAIGLLCWIAYLLTDIIFQVTKILN
jgi:hypothetical protein